MPLKIISSMATKALLAELAAAYRAVDAAADLQIESVGGVDAAKRVQAGEAFDGVVLASNAIDSLIEAGRLVAGSRADLVRSGIYVAVKAGAAAPAIDSEDAVRQAVLAAPSIGYSTGPSGVYLQKLFERWGIAAQIQERTVQAKPGVPVGRLVAAGEIALGFQQLSELMNEPGLQVLGPLPPAIQQLTVFSGGVTVAGTQAEAVRAWLAWCASPATAEIKRRNGMEAA
ncbi:MAG: substrate-binding domain-containing protein [Proteobacteria bacterium]|nr:substrate-binding domain-containing protein [Pseudomonadota bacterium]